jgi:hypothetical protein
MNLDALPYTSFIVLAEFCVGSLAVCVYAERRGRVAKSFVQFCAWMVVVGALVLLLNGLALDPNAIVGGYRLEDGLLRAVRIASAVFLALCLPYAVLLGLTAYYVSLPTWGFAGMLLSILGGTLAVGAVVLAMTLGHWYLVTPRLPREPMEELTLIVLAAVVLQALLLVINVFIPVRDAPDATAFLGSKTLEVNPAFWLRIIIGLAFPAALAWMSYVASRGYPANENAMMSATGLLYIAVGAVVVGEVLARGLLFLTGVPV